MRSCSAARSAVGAEPSWPPSGDLQAGLGSGAAVGGHVIAGFPGQVIQAAEGFGNARPGGVAGQALDQTAGFLRDDPAGVAALWDTVGQLAGEPRPPESFPYGSPDLRRLRAGRYRVFYTIDEERRVVQVDHVARLP